MVDTVVNDIVRLKAITVVFVIRLICSDFDSFIASVTQTAHRGPGE